MQDFITHYETMSQLTQQMVEAARANNWDTLADLERSLGTIRDQLVRIDDTQIKLSEDQRQRKRELILRMLDDDREIRRHTEHWMKSVRSMLAGNIMERNLRETYGAGPH